MRSFLEELRKRNKSLYWFGWYNLVLGLVCLVLMQFDSQQVLGISRWIKPLKFFISVWIMVWSMGWFLTYLDNKRKVRIISWLIIITMFIENFLITMQSARGVSSHFNVSDGFNGMVFSTMGIAIILFTFTVTYAEVLFFRQQRFSIQRAYLWGIRLRHTILYNFFFGGRVYAFPDVSYCWRTRWRCGAPVSQLEYRTRRSSNCSFPGNPFTSDTSSRRQLLL